MKEHLRERYIFRFEFGSLEVFVKIPITEVK